MLGVTDIVMPGIDGIELLKTLRSTRKTQMIPVLLISARAIDELRIEGFNEGADAFLAKPYTERELRACIGSMLQSKNRRDETARREGRKQAEEQALADRAILLESITDAFYALDREFRLTYVNRRALDHFGETPETLLGRVLWDVLPVTRGTVYQQEYKRPFTSSARWHSKPCRLLGADGSRSAPIPRRRGWPRTSATSPAARRPRSNCGKRIVARANF
jgi:PAS domain S-box-containing protein